MIFLALTELRTHIWVGGKKNIILQLTPAHIHRNILHCYLVGNTFLVAMENVYWNEKYFPLKIIEIKRNKYTNAYENVWVKETHTYIKVRKMFKWYKRKNCLGDFRLQPAQTNKKKRGKYVYYWMAGWWLNFISFNSSYLQQHCKTLFSFIIPSVYKFSIEMWKMFVCTKNVY